MFGESSAISGPTSERINVLDSCNVQEGLSWFESPVALSADRTGGQSSNPASTLDVAPAKQNERMRKSKIAIPKRAIVTCNAGSHRHKLLSTSLELLSTSLPLCAVSLLS